MDYEGNATQILANERIVFEQGRVLNGNPVASFWNPDRVVDSPGMGIFMEEAGELLAQINCLLKYPTDEELKSGYMLPEDRKLILFDYVPPTSDTVVRVSTAPGDVYRIVATKFRGARTDLTLRIAEAV